MISTVPGQAEHDAEGWWQAAILAIRQAISAIDSAQIQAIGVSCTNGLIAVDESGVALRPAIMLWDQRALSEVDHVRSVLGADQIEAVTGNRCTRAYSLPTMLCQTREPETFIMPTSLWFGRLPGR
jgi:sugar (pentulose or hexulose) kinase